MTREAAGHAPVNTDSLPFGSGVILPINHMTSKNNWFKDFNMCINMYQINTNYFISSRILILRKRLLKNNTNMIGLGTNQFRCGDAANLLI